MAYDPEKAKQICDILAENEIAKSLRQACDIVGISPWSFLRWCNNKRNTLIDDDGMTVSCQQQYARANEIKADLDFEALVQLNDEQPVKLKNGAVDIGWAAYHRERLNNKKWILSKRRPSKYGDKLEVDGSLKHEHSVSRESLISRITESPAIQQSVTHALPANVDSSSDGKVSDETEG
jgi:hypothetical protein